MSDLWDRKYAERAKQLLAELDAIPMGTNENEVKRDDVDRRIALMMDEYKRDQAAEKV